MNKNKTNFLNLCQDDKGFYFVNKQGRRTQYFETAHEAWGMSLTPGDLLWRKKVKDE